MSDDLKAYRKAHSLNQQQLADLLGISKSAVSMIETGERSLSATAAARFAELEQPAIPQPAQEPFYIGRSLQKLKEEHERKSDEYLLSRKKDCEIELHGFEKQLRGWEERFKKAYTDLYLADHHTQQMAQQAMPQKFIADSVKKRMAAEETLEQIGRQKPELVMAKIDGLKREIRSLKARLGKQRQYLGMKEILKIAGLPTLLENRQDNKALPPADDAPL